MSNYTTQTAALKAVTVDTRLLDAKRINTKKLFINGSEFDPSQIKSPVETVVYMFTFVGGEVVEKMKSNTRGEIITEGFEGTIMHFDEYAFIREGEYFCLTTNDTLALADYKIYLMTEEGL